MDGWLSRVESLGLPLRVSSTAALWWKTCFPFNELPEISFLRNSSWPACANQVHPHPVLHILHASGIFLIIHILSRALIKLSHPSRSFSLVFAQAFISMSFAWCSILMMRGRIMIDLEVEPTCIRLICVVINRLWNWRSAMLVCT